MPESSRIPTTRMYGSLIPLPWPSLDFCFPGACHIVAPGIESGANASSIDESDSNHACK